MYGAVPRMAPAAVPTALSVAALGQGLAGDELHYEKAPTVGLLPAVDGRDVRMVQGRKRPGFPLEAGGAVAIMGHRLRKELECDFAAELRVGRPVHVAHSAGPEMRRML
jgi:hypothetical protein